MKALRAQMNPHFLFNSLNSVKMLINKGNSADAKSYLTKYSKLIRQILEYSREKFIRLDEEMEMLSLYLDLEQVRFKNFEYTIDVAPGLEADFIEIPPMLLQPFVENAIWHGLMNKPDDPRNLSIIVHQEKSNTVIIIEDNGIGRKQAQLLKSRKGSQRESLGLRIGQERIDILKEQYGDGAKMQIIDLENPTGTRVVISLPVAE
jgi:LytS/YehU family sensor histidine kinase